MLRKSIVTLPKPTIEILARNLPSSSLAFHRFLSSSQQRDDDLVCKVEGFLQRFKSKSMDQRILLQQLPNLLIELSEAAQQDSGPIVNKILDEIQSVSMIYSRKVYALVSEFCYLFSLQDVASIASGISLFVSRQLKFG